MECGFDFCFPRPATNIEEVGRFAAIQLHHIHRRHRQPGPVDHTANRAVELDEGDVSLAGEPFGLGFVGGIAQGGEVGVTEEGAVVKQHLRVKRLETPVGADD